MDFYQREIERREHETSALDWLLWKDLRKKRDSYKTSLIEDFLNYIRDRKI